MRVTADNLCLSLGPRSILDHVDIIADSGTSLALVGHSGSGKTTLLNCLGLLLPIDSGRLSFDGSDMTGANGAQRSRFWRKHVAFIFQDYGLVEDESVGFNVQMSTAPLFRRRIKHPDALQALAEVGLEGRYNDPIAHLSGGERQRVSIARAIYKKATLILADEPTASLDDDNRQLVQDLLLNECHRGATVITATHDPRLAASCTTTLSLDTEAQDPPNNARPANATATPTDRLDC